MTGLTRWLHEVLPDWNLPTHYASVTHTGFKYLPFVFIFKTLYFKMTNDQFSE